MKTGLAILGFLGLALSTDAALAAPTPGQKAEFHSLCLAISGNEALCTCKADAAMTLLDQAFMTQVIAGMKGKAPPKEDAAEYGRYIAQSNARCLPGY